MNIKKYPRIGLIFRRILFILSIIPLCILGIFLYVVYIAAELSWAVIGYFTGKTHHEFLEWTDVMMDWIEDLMDRTSSLNSLPKE